jgi:hypothetical protein
VPLPAGRLSAHLEQLGLTGLNDGLLVLHNTLPGGACVAYAAGQGSMACFAAAALYKQSGAKQRWVATNLVCSKEQ